MKGRFFFVSFFLVISFFACSHRGSYTSAPLPYEIRIPWLILNAGSDDPVYTTYAATIQRSRLYSDKAYKLHFGSSEFPHYYGSEMGGRFYTIWEVNGVIINNATDFFKKPILILSFPDMLVMEYQPINNLTVAESFLVFSSSMAMVELNLKNLSNDTLTIDCFPVIEFGCDSMEVRSFVDSLNGFLAQHHESRKRLMSNLYTHAPYPEHLVDLFSLDSSVFSYGLYQGNSASLYNHLKTDYYSENRSDSLNGKQMGKASLMVLQERIKLIPGQTKRIRYFRGVQDVAMDLSALADQKKHLQSNSVQKFLDDNFDLYSHVPELPFKTLDDKRIYISALNLIRSCMLPPEGKTRHNYYVFSREPIWGWGHGHQVLHESLSMLAYALMDPWSAQESQRVYIEQQRADGLIAYRHGPRGLQDYPHKAMSTTSAPFFNWINLELYNFTKDSVFLKEAYLAGKKYIDWLCNNRDNDRDGTFEWGPYGIIENVRDWYNAVFQVSNERFLEVDKEDISDELECLDLTCMIINEMRSLATMAQILEEKEESEKWLKMADSTSLLLNSRMWDEKSKFFYSVDKEKHSFYFMSKDLKRQEIIGFLPMWARAVSKERAALLVQTLSDTTRFWRKNGIPTLSAMDPWYSPYVDYCCKWNGPVWLLWDYMVYRGLKNYGYDKEASALADKLVQTVRIQLKTNHSFWESYSPDNDNLNSPSNYIWDAIIARILWEEFQD